MFDLLDYVDLFITVFNDIEIQKREDSLHD